MKTLMLYLTAVLFSFHGFAEQLSVTNLKVREFIPGAVSSVAYFMLSNQSETAKTLIEVKIKGVERTELHQHSHVDGLMKMEQVSQVEVPAQESVVFQPGGLHLMLFEPTSLPVAGEMTDATFKFSDGEQITVRGQIISLMRQEHDHSHH
ncbi:copper chaperone PCu(A)C [Pseudoalteromonas tunicata]|jgi:copper(I)-binding protein|uniref:Copper chaperone PCu(A)C n=1 Tax=Pseudoalteromonas tunicata D2 TaxID=87626 RepID=A4C8W4_9GAMM|nr:copper chaperone PCu(A)C [Pseudoalteromonas tunicata]ATC93532.1 hypothetical protein PTUN_a0805 [Pseudoalteromonas tunicata]AXT29375.1 copper chaperone PCu(A)C [Pseudoalteromonas tunicata]EAR29029.1 hypothetical protein PTD2_08294 [Pseudoalteromonas tunicata D2]